MPVSSWVDSVEFIDATISGANNSSSYSLSKGQDYTHCIPFYTVCGDSTYWDNRLTDVYFSGTTQSGIINFARSNNRATSSYIKCYVVEFNPAQVRVQQGSFSLTGLTTTAITLSTTVSGIDRTAMTFAWQSNDTAQYTSRVAVRGRVLNTTSIDFYRNIATSNCTGHWFLFEDLGNNFRVTHLDSSHAATGQTLNIGSQRTVDPLRTFVLGSYANSSTDTGYSSEWTTRLFLYSIGTVRSDRSSGAYTIYWAVQVVEILDQTKVYTPMDHALIGWTTPTTYAVNSAGVQGRVPLLCNPNTSTIVTAMMQGWARVDTNTTAANNSCMVSSELTASGTITYTKYGTTYAANPSYTVAVDWAGITMASGTNLFPIPEGNGPNESFVKSVENFRFTLTGPTGVYVLTKGQIVSNCVAFTSNRSNSDTSDTINIIMVNVYLKEPGLVYMQHWPVSGIVSGTAEAVVDVSIVEFYPSQIKVQQKIVNIDTAATTINVTIDAISSIDKAFILSSMFTPSITNVNAFKSVFCRISFTTTTNIELYKNIAGNENICTLFIVEDLQNNFVSIHNTSTFSTANDSFYNETYNWGFHNSFPIVTYTTNENDNYPQNGALRGLYFSPYKPVYCSRQSASYSIYSYVTVVKFIDEKRHTQPVAKDLLVGTASVTSYYSPELRGTGNITAYNPVQYSTIHCATNSSATTSEAFGTIRIVNYTTGEYEVSKVGAAVNSYFGGHIINWPGFHYQDANNIVGTHTKSFINSIQRDSFSTDGGWMEIWLRYNQDITKCIPFITHSSGATDGNLTRLYKSVYRYSDPDCFRICFGGNNTSSRNILSYIVEFNQDIKIQYGSGYTTGTSRVFTIEEVNLDRAFLHFFSSCDSWAIQQRSHAVCGYFSSSTQISFIRDYAAGGMYISWYVVECPDWGADSYWTVQHNFSSSLGSAATLNAWLSKQPSLNRTMYLTSYSTNEAEGAPQYAAWRMYNRQDHGVQMDKSSTGYSMQSFNVEAIEFSSSLIAKGLQIYSNFYTLGSTTLTSDVDLRINTHNDFEMQRSLIIQAYNQNLTRVDTTATAGFQEGFHYLVFKDLDDDGYSDTITASRNTGSYNSYGFYYAIQFPAYNKYYFSGYVTEQGAPVSRKVRAYKTSTGEIMDTTMSISGTGYFYLETAAYEQHYIVAIDDDDGLSFNDLIYGKIYPEPISGAFAWATDSLTVSGVGEYTP